MTVSGSNARDTWSACRQTALANLGAAFENVDADLIGSIADDLRPRDRVFVAGADTSYAAAIYLYLIGRLSLPSFQLLELEFGAFLDDIVDMTHRDAVVCLSPTPSSKAMLRLAELARERGALVVTLSDSRSAPLSALSDRVLIVPQRGPSRFHSHVAVLAIVELLVACILSGEGEAASERIDRIQADRLLLERL